MGNQMKPQVVVPYPRDLDLAMFWGIHPDEGAPHKIDIGTDAPDGVYGVEYTLGDDVGTAKGVTVENGAFVLEPTCMAVFEAVSLVGAMGEIIEALEYIPDREIFLVTITDA